MEYSHRVVINRPPHRVFDYLADPTNLPAWQPSVEEVRREWEGQPEAGLGFTEKRSFLGRQIESSVEIAIYDPPQNFTINIDSGPVSLIVEHLLRETSEGTEITVTARGRVKALPRVAGALAVRTAKRQAKQNFNRLKLILERPGEGASSRGQAARPPAR